MQGMFEPVIPQRKNRTSHAHVVDELGKEIISGHYPVGCVLPGDVELAERFKVSRTVLREAMKTLAAKGLVVARARIGTKVTPRNQWNLFDGDILGWHFHRGIDEEFLSHLSEMRMAFEPFAASLAARHASPEQIKMLFRYVDDMDNPAHTAESLAYADMKLHLGIAEASGNPFMRSISSLIEAALVGVFTLSSNTALGSRVREVAQSHKAIVEAIAAGNAVGAADAMRGVIVTGREKVTSKLANNTSIY